MTTTLIVEPDTNVHGPAAQLVPERNYANAYAAYWQARSGFFTPASSADRSRERSDEPTRHGAATRSLRPVEAGRSKA
jgi:hypothetical protein